MRLLSRSWLTKRYFCTTCSQGNAIISFSGNAAVSALHAAAGSMCRGFVYRTRCCCCCCCCSCIRCSKARPNIIKHDILQTYLYVSVHVCVCLCVLEWANAQWPNAICLQITKLIYSLSMKMMRNRCQVGLGDTWQQLGNGTALDIKALYIKCSRQSSVLSAIHFIMLVLNHI